MNEAILINGAPGESVSILDRGLLYGDGLFETMAWRNQRLQHWDRHERRLRDGCKRLGLAAPASETVQRELNHLAADQDRCVLKLVVTRGSGNRGYRPPAGAATTRIAMRLPWPDYPQRSARDGVTLRYCETRLGLNPRLAGIKHLNRLEQVLARAEWGDEYDEGLMLDSNDNVIEGTMSNLFTVRDAALLTPDLSQCGVAGVVRGWVLEVASQLGMAATTGCLRRDDVYRADEIFLTNSLIGIWPVRQLGDRGFEPGPVTRILQQEFEKVAG